MYDYIALRINADPCSETITDLIADSLAEIGFESFEPDESGLTAYIRKDLYDLAIIKDILSEFPIHSEFTFSKEIIEGEDWNKEWEQNYFKPINIDGRCLIRSSFHEDFQTAPIEILIDPKMAFGTGHHATTAGMVRLLLSFDLNGATVIDMGTGTGILAILCKKLGAVKVSAIEIDPFALENAEENGHLNIVEVQWFEGDAKKLDGLASADYFLANINLNVILEDLEKYVAHLKTGGKILLSGFYEKDIPSLTQKFHQLHLKEIKRNVENEWVAMALEKEATE